MIIPEIPIQLSRNDFVLIYTTNEVNMLDEREKFLLSKKNLRKIFFVRKTKIHNYQKCVSASLVSLSATGRKGTDLQLVS